MSDYAEHTRALKIHLKTLDDYLLHDDLSQVNTLLKSMQRHLVELEVWVEQRKIILERWQALVAQYAIKSTDV